MYNYDRCMNKWHIFGILLYNREKAKGRIAKEEKNCYIKTVAPKISLADVPKFSPRIVTRVPGGPSLGEMPVTCGVGPRATLISKLFFC